MPKDQSREKKPRHFTCRRCLKPGKIAIKYYHMVPQTVKFPTSDGLDKHLQTKHNRAMYSCTAVGCYKGTSAPKFQRSETLTQHIKESHNPDTFYTCPIKTCNLKPSKLDDVALHTHLMHTKPPSEVGARSLYKDYDHDASVDAVINAASWKYFRCPIWNCRKFVSGGHKKVSTHLLEHSPIELENAQDELAMDGYEIQSGPSVVSLIGESMHSGPVQIKCPACEVRCENDAKFKHHIEASHMLATSPGMLEHFETWRENIISWKRKEHAKAFRDLPCWLNEAKNKNYWRSSARFRKCSYSTCSFHSENNGGDHPSFLRPAEEIATDLWPHRMGILRHYPQFITHPMLQEQHAVLGSC
jgi:hypothetical protein